VPCYFCARAVADAIVRREVAWVRARFEVTEELEQARALALERRQPRNAEEAAEYARAGAGLAAGYVGLGMQGAALITAALALTWGVTAEESWSSSAAEVVFAGTLLSDAGRKLLVDEFGWASA